MNENISISNRDNLDDNLLSKKKEIEAISHDILLIKKTAATLKPAVQEYNTQMQKAHGLDKVRKQKEKEYNTVITFLQNVDDHYLDAMFPLFKENHEALAEDEAANNNVAA